MNLEGSKENCLSNHVINEVRIPPQSLTLKMAIARLDETSESYHHSTRLDPRKPKSNIKFQPIKSKESEF